MQWQEKMKQVLTNGKGTKLKLITTVVSILKMENRSDRKKAESNGKGMSKNSISKGFSSETKTLTPPSTPKHKKQENVLVNRNVIEDSLTHQVFNWNFIIQQILIHTFLFC